MKTTKIHALLALVLCALFIASCKKSDPAKETPNLLTKAPWKISAFEWQTTDGRWLAPPPSSSVPTYPRTMTLFENGTYSSGTTTGAYGTWQLSADKTQLIMFTKSGSSVTASIAALSETALQLSVPLDKDTYTSEGPTNNLTFTYYTTERTTFSH